MQFSACFLILRSELFIEGKKGPTYLNILVSLLEQARGVYWAKWPSG
jgi:hypothetical protein